MATEYIDPSLVSEVVASGRLTHGWQELQHKQEYALDSSAGKFSQYATLAMAGESLGSDRTNSQVAVALMQLSMDNPSLSGSFQAFDNALTEIQKAEVNGRKLSEVEQRVATEMVAVTMQNQLGGNVVLTPEIVRAEIAQATTTAASYVNNLQTEFAASAKRASEASAAAQIRADQYLKDIDASLAMDAERENNKREAEQQMRAEKSAEREAQNPLMFLTWQEQQHKYPADTPSGIFAQYATLAMGEKQAGLGVSSINTQVAVQLEQLRETNPKLVNAFNAFDGAIAHIKDPDNGRKLDMLDERSAAGMVAMMMQDQVSQQVRLTSAVVDTDISRAETSASHVEEAHQGYGMHR